MVRDDRGGEARGGRSIRLVPSNRPPLVAAERSLTVAPLALGMPTPSDPDGDALTITVTAVPDRGAVRLEDRVVAVGQSLTADELRLLRFDPPVDARGDVGRFEIAVDDGRGGRASTAVRLTVGPAAAESVPVAAAAPPAAVAVAAAPQPTPSPEAPKAEATIAAATPPAVAASPAEAPPAAAPAEVVATRAVVAQTAPARTETVTRAVGPFRDCEHCPEMLPLPAGSFVMGRDRGDLSERPAHKVTIARPFALARYETTVDQWQMCVDDQACSLPELTPVPGPGSPMRNLSFMDAQQYVGWLAKKSGKPYRMPSEAEWEYGARGATTTAYWWGDAVGFGKADCSDCGGAWDRHQPRAVGSFPANPFGLFDTSGGVAEWVADCWFGNYVGAPNVGTARPDKRCSMRVLRGGSWRNGKDDITSTSRLGYDAVVRYYANGLRVARDLN